MPEKDRKSQSTSDQFEKNERQGDIALEAARGRSRGNQKTQYYRILN